jgi:dUTP pyrophosphatase
MTEIIESTRYSCYEKYMYLKIYVEDSKLKKLYLDAVKIHNEKDEEFIDAGFDLLVPENIYLEDRNSDNIYLKKIDFKVKCAAQIINTSSKKAFNTGFYIYPRSSISKSELRLANNTGIIDAGYRGNLIGVFDILPHLINPKELIDKNEYLVKEGKCLIQICGPSLVPIYIEVVNTLEDLGKKTERGECGFGSTGN